MLLNTTSQKIQVIIEAAPTTTQPTFATTYSDIVVSGVWTPGMTDGVLNGTTPVDVVAAPAAATARHIKELLVYNADTVQHVVTIQLVDGVNTRILNKLTVPAGQSCRYADPGGYMVGVTGGGGTVTSVALTAPTELTVAGSPITGSGTVALSWANEAANKIFAGPVSGGAAAPAFRSLVAADIAGLVGATSVGLALPASIFTVTGSPVTSTGTLTGTLNSQSANQFFAGPTSGVAATPGFRALVAADVTSVLGTMAVQNANAVAITGGTLDGITSIGAATPGLAVFSPTMSVVATGTGTNAIANVTGEGTGNQINVTTYRSSTADPGITLVKNRGTAAAPASVVNGDFCGRVLMRGGIANTPITGVQMQGFIEEPTPSATAMGASLRISTPVLGSATLTETVRIFASTGLSMYGANPVIDQNRHHVQRVYTIATLPAAPGSGDYTAAVSDLGGGQGLVEWSGAGPWRRVGEGGTQTVASDAAATFTWQPLTNATFTNLAVATTIARTVTLGATGIYDGCVAEFARQASSTGGFTWTVGGKALPAGSFVKFRYSASAAAWIEVAFGSL